jgi:hypothetical protein
MPFRNAISSDLKRAAVRMCRVLPISTVALLLGISEITIRRTLKLYEETGDVIPIPTGRKRGRKPILSEDDLKVSIFFPVNWTLSLITHLFKFIEGIVEARPDRYLDEFQERIRIDLDKKVSLTTLWHTLDGLDITNKRVSSSLKLLSGPLTLIMITFSKLTRPASERDLDQRAQYIDVVSQYSANQLVFTDESYCDKRNTARLTGWSKQGTRATVDAPFRRGRRCVYFSFLFSLIILCNCRYSILPALSLDGILDVVVVEGSVTGEIFMRFIEGLVMEMNPYPQKNSVLVMDNATIHTNENIQAYLEERYVK